MQVEWNVCALSWTLFRRAAIDLLESEKVARAYMLLPNSDLWTGILRVVRGFGWKCGGAGCCILLLDAHRAAALHLTPEQSIRSHVSTCLRQAGERAGCCPFPMPHGNSKPNVRAVAV